MNYVYECDNCPDRIEETKYRKIVPFKSGHSDPIGQDCSGKFFRVWTNARGKAPQVRVVGGTGAGRDFDKR